MSIKATIKNGQKPLILFIDTELKLARDTRATRGTRATF